MAPPTLVHSRAEIWNRYREQFSDPEKYQCHLKSITQHECTFQVSKNKPPEIICLPFKRIFQRCLENTITKDKSGNKIKSQKWVNFEVTDESTNQDLMSEEKYGKDVNDFLSAEKELRKLMEGELQ
ncbi:hypothetical protein CAAN1_23S01684 [[Candida] anglica]|uniref:Uncharacterized protein n=1 Tax=[Candida] anglica TaxID=148631 RepID=A0ABP0E9M8_9ASCO